LSGPEATLPAEEPVRVRWAILVVATAVLYFAAAKLSLVFAIPPGFASAVWPPAGIAAALLMLRGLSLWPGVWIGLAAANLTVQPSIFTPFVIGAGGALEAAFIAWSVRRVIGAPEALLADAGNVFRFVGLTLGAAAISASIANGVLMLAGSLTVESLALNWITWWLGDAMGILLVAPLAVALTLHRGVGLSAARALELVIAFGVLLATLAVVFFEFGQANDARPIMFLLVPPLIWIAARFDAREVTAASAIACALAMYATVLGKGPFAGISLNVSLLLQQAFICTIAVVGLALSVSVNELKRAHAELQVFVNLASHDLQEPVRNILGFTDLLQQRYGPQMDADGHEFLHYVANGARRMQKLIDDTLTLARASGTPVSPQPTEAGAALEAALKNLATAVAETRAEVTSDPLPAVLAERLLLAQLFQNVVGNALKFRGENRPRIHVSASLAGRRVLFSVRDNGIGIAPKDHQRIFGMFERLHGRAAGGGAGVGLALCKRIVERYGGRIWVESQAALGATFYFSLPHSDVPRR